VIVDHCLSTGVSVLQDEQKPNTIECTQDGGVFMQQ